MKLHFSFFVVVFLSKENINDKVLATERLAPVVNAQKSSGVAPKEVHLVAKTRVQKDMRSELLGETNTTTGRKFVMFF